VAGKLIVGGAEAGPTLLRGIDLVADGVARTFGPCGRSAILQRADAGPLVTSSGLRISESIELVRDPFLNQGVQLLREVARENHARVGDGNTAAMLVAREIAREAVRMVAAGASPPALRAAIADASAEAAAWIETQARPVAGRHELAAIAASAARDLDWGELIADALVTVGANGVVTVEDDRMFGVSLALREGMAFENGLAARDLATDPIRRETVLDRPYVLVASERLTEISQLAPILRAVAAERTGLLIIAEEISGDALTMLVLNVRKRRIPAVAVKAPMFGSDRDAALQDIAVLTGGEVHGPALGCETRRATVGRLGLAERVTITSRDTTIVGGAGDPVAIARRQVEVAREIDYLETEYERDKRRRRLARLGGSIAVIRVGRDTGTEQEETRNRLNAGIRAARAALRGGVVPGGGSTLLRAKAAVRPTSGDDEIGRAIVRRALETPVRQIARNAGIDAASAVSRTEHAPPGHGLDIERDRVVDLHGVGILDAANVLCSVMTVAASVAGTCVLAHGIVCDRPLPRMRRRSHGHHHGPDGGHFGPAAQTDAAHTHRHDHGAHGHSHEHEHPVHAEL
jgi:chaperonin GroEL